MVKNPAQARTESLPSIRPRSAGFVYEPTKILIVDDEPMIRFHLTESLLGKYAVRSAHGILQAMDIIASAPPHIVLVDIHLQGETGLSLLRKVKPLYPRLPVILMTGYLDRPVAEAAAREGAFHVLEKPFRRDDLLGVLESAAKLTA